MKKLNSEAFSRGRHFLIESARPLDRALFEYRFEGAPSQQVLDALAMFQNEDGGFGHGLEPDARTPSSSPMATGIGLKILREVGSSDKHPMVRLAVSYLLSAYDPVLNVWPALPDDTNDYPHAPWWYDDEGSLAETFDNFVIMPRAQLVGLLVDYSSLVPDSWLTALTQLTVEGILAVEELGTGGGDDLLYVTELAKTDSLSQDFKEPLIERVRSVTPAVISSKPEDWRSYAITPLKAAPSPDYPAADLIRDKIELYLDYLIDMQSTEGYWRPTWSWGDFYPEVWNQAEVEWQGHLTLETLTSLRAYNRIDKR